MHHLVIGLKSSSIVSTSVKSHGVAPIFGVIQPWPYEWRVGAAPMTVNMNACTTLPTEIYRMAERFTSIMGNGHFGAWQECRNLLQWHSRCWIFGPMRGVLQRFGGRFQSRIQWGRITSCGQQSISTLGSGPRFSTLEVIGTSYVSLKILIKTKDFPITEKLDYFSAALTILYALYYTITRLFHVYPSPPASRLTLASNPTTTWKRNLLACVCLFIFLAHVSYLTLLPHFDYAYNIAFNLTLGLTHNALWVMYAMPASLSIFQRFPSRPKSYRPRFTNKVAVFLVLTMAATCLELFDFPPWARIIDAHSLWHLSTAPIALKWYDFLVEDSLDPSWREHKA